MSGSRLAMWIVAIVLGLAWIAFSIRYGLDPDISPAFKRSMGLVGVSALFGTLVWSVRAKKSSL